jgi:hypothetical protein
MQRDIFSIVKKELQTALSVQITQKTPNKIYLQRFRDLLIGIVLNICCNVESDEVIWYMLSNDVM